ncbi:MAG: acyl carrier protein [Lachnospiraceae bacterium]|nr:acyl carrier protein [Lachnospiraceae bacterium]
MREKVYDIISKKLEMDINDINDELRIADVEAWDSLTYLLILEEIEMATGKTIPIEKAAEAESVGQLVEWLEEE